MLKGLMWASLAALVLALAVHTSTPPAQAQEPKPTPDASSGPGPGRVPPPPGNCWSGALSEDPVFCYFLEEAQRAGEIEVAAVYETPGGGRLYIYLRQSEHVSDEVGAFFKEKAHEYLESAEGHGAYGAYECDGKTGEERRRADALPQRSTGAALAKVGRIRYSDRPLSSSPVKGLRENLPVPRRC